MIMLPRNAMSTAADQSMLISPNILNILQIWCWKWNPPVKIALQPNFQVPVTNTLCSKLILSFIYINNGDAQTEVTWWGQLFGTFQRSGSAECNPSAYQTYNQPYMKAMALRTTNFVKKNFDPTMYLSGQTNYARKHHKMKSYAKDARFSFVKFYQ